MMYVMCDMLQFVLVVPVSDESFTTLADHLFQHILIKFSGCHLVVLDDSTPIHIYVFAIYNILDLNDDILAKHNHKGLSVENFYRFLNKATTIEMEDRQSNNVFVPVGIPVGVRGIVSLSMELIPYIVPLILTIDSDFNDINLSPLSQLS